MTTGPHRHTAPRRSFWLRLCLAAALTAPLALVPVYAPPVGPAYADMHDDGDEDAPVRRKRRDKDREAEKPEPRSSGTIKTRSSGGIIGGLGGGGGSGGAATPGPDAGPDMLVVERRPAGSGSGMTGGPGGGKDSAGGGTKDRANGGSGDPDEDGPTRATGDRPAGGDAGAGSNETGGESQDTVRASLTHGEEAAPGAVRDQRSTDCDTISLTHGVQCVAVRMDGAGASGGAASEDPGRATAYLDIDIRSVLTSTDGERTFDLTLDTGRPLLVLPENLSARSRRQVVADMALVMARLRAFAKTLNPEQSRRLKIEKKVTLRLRSPFAGLIKLKLVGPVRVPVRYRGGVKLRVVDLEGAPLDSLTHHQPFRIEAKFSAPADDRAVVLMSWEDGETEPEIDLSPVFDDSGRISQQRLRSDVLYLRSRQFSGRAEHKGLFQDERYFEDYALERARTSWRADTARSEAETARRFKGKWHVAHVEDGGARKFSGLAEVAEDGKSADLVLIDDKGFKRYTSVETRTLAAAAGGRNQLEVRFERVLNLPAEGPDSAGLEPLLKARFLDLPTLTDKVRFTLREAKAEAAVSLEPAPDERFRVLLTERSTGRLAGHWNEERPDGSLGAGGQETWGRKPEIRFALALDDQFRRRQPTKAHYPFGRNRDKGAGRRRTVFVYGKGLPAGYGDARIVESVSPGMSYTVRLLDEGASGFTAADGWALARKVDKAFTKPEDYTALFLVADFDDKVIPGAQVFTVNGASGSWLLTFADAFARLYFTQVPPLDGTPTETAYGGSVVYLEARLDTQLPLPDGLTVDLHRNGAPLVTPGADGAKDQPVQVTLSKLTGEAVAGDPGSPSRAGLIYRSGPIHLYRSDRRLRSPPGAAGALRIDVREETDAEKAKKAKKPPEPPSKALGPAAAPLPDRQRRKGNLGSLSATWDKPHLLRIPRPALLAVYDKPADLGGTVWLEALGDARGCYEGGEHLDIQSQADELSRFVIAEIFSAGNLKRGVRKLFAPDDPEAAALSAASPGMSILREAGTRRNPVSLGDHAAALLLRDEFIKAAQSKASSYGGTLNLGRVMDIFLDKALRDGPGADPLWQTAKVEIGGDEVPLKSLLDLGKFPELKAKYKIIGYSGARDFLRTQTRKAMRASIKAIEASIKTTQNKGNCDLEHLMVVSARRAPELVAAIVPRLVRLEGDGRNQWWAPDPVARGYVTQLHTLGSAVRALDDYARLDKAVAAMTVIAVTGVGALFAAQAGALSTAAYITLAADLVDVAVFGTYGVVDYVDRHDDLDFARGASTVLGADMYLEAEANDPSGLWTAAGVLLPGLGALGSLGNLKALRNIDRGAEIARKLGRFDEASLARLSEPDAKALLAYIAEVKRLQALLRKGGLDGAAERLLRLNRRKLSEADQAFLGRYDDFLKTKKAQIDRGFDVARRLDDADAGSLAKLTGKQRKDLAAYVNDIRTRQAALRNPPDPSAAGRIQLVSEREARLVAKLGDAIASPAKGGGKGIKVADAGSLGGKKPGGGRKPGDQAGGGKKPGDQTGGGKKPGDQAGGGKKPGDQAGSGKKPGDQAGSGKKPGDQAGGGKKPGDQAGSGNNQLAGKGGKGTCSFHGETLILTRRGEVPIRDVHVGDEVMARDEASGETAWKAVVAHYANRYEHTLRIVILDLESGASHVVRSNRIHPFFVVSKEQQPELLAVSGGEPQRGKGSLEGDWVEAAQLRSGDRLLGTGGGWSEIVNVSSARSPFTAFNLTVADFHTYFVKGPSANDNVPSVWVHNKCDEKLPTGSRRADPPVTKYGQPRYRAPDGDEYYRGWDGRYYRDRVFENGVLRVDPEHPPTPRPSGAIAGDAVGPPPFVREGKAKQLRQDLYEDLLEELRAAGLTEDEVAEFIRTDELISYHKNIRGSLGNMTGQERRFFEERLEQLADRQEALWERMRDLARKRGEPSSVETRFTATNEFGNVYQVENNFAKIEDLRKSLQVESFQADRLITGRRPGDVGEFELSFSTTTSDLRNSFSNDKILNPNTGKMEDPSAPTDLDHVWPVSEITRGKQFRGLSIDKQKAVIHDPELLMRMDSGLNRAKQDRIGSDFRRWMRDERGYNKYYVDFMMKRQRQAQDYADVLVDCLAKGGSAGACQQKAIAKHPRPTYTPPA